jgi:tetratricopeptide (TPR) repeat protein
MKDYFEYIEEYVSGRLNLEDKMEFEAAMQHDVDLIEAVNNFQLAKNLSASLIEDETRQILKGIKSKPGWNKLTTILISILIISGLMTFYFLFVKQKDQVPYDENQIFAQLYETPASLASRNEVKEVNALNTAIHYFDKGDLKTSYPIFASLSKSDSTNLRIKRYLAHIYLRESDYAQAENIFKQLLESGNPEQIAEAEYNLIIIYLIQKKKREATMLFNSLKSKDIISANKMKMIKSYLNQL